MIEGAVGGYCSAIPCAISAGETVLTHMKCVTRKAYSNKTKKNRWKNQSTNYNKLTQTPRTTLLKCVVRNRHKMQYILFRRAWIVYLFSVRVTGKPIRPTPLYSLYPCYTYCCPLPSLIILSLHFLPLKRLTHWT